MSNNTYFPCYNCGAEIKDGTFKSNNLFSKNDTAIINEYSDNPKNGYCDKCGLKLFKEAELKLKAEKSSIKEEIRLLLDQIPIFTIQYLPNWEYKVLGMVTGQSTTGTGIITEFTSSFTDFFGEQSKKHNAKLKAGEMLSSYQMRSHTFEMGGNAIIGVDIDYTDSGDGKGMLIVCMSGTAINADESCFSESQINSIKSLKAKKARLEYLKQFKLYVIV